MCGTLICLAQTSSSPTMPPIQTHQKYSVAAKLPMPKKTIVSSSRAGPGRILRIQAPVGTLARVTEAARDERDIVCPHCKKPFTGELLPGAAERYRGFKCPHCKLFVPAERAPNHSG